MAVLGDAVVVDPGALTGVTSQALFGSIHTIVLGDAVFTDPSVDVSGGAAPPTDGQIWPRGQKATG